jgi:LysW-gamma-L-lysine/LysW-L-ornithine aminotransferase
MPLTLVTGRVKITLMNNFSEQTLAQLEESFLGGTTARRGDVVMARGQGCWLWDTADRRYLDLGSAQGVAMLGHCHPTLSAALAAQAQQLISCPNFLYNDTRARFAAKLAEILPAHLQHLFLANSGAEAIDGALKFARLTTGRTRFVAFTRGFHGRTVGALSVTHDPKYREPFNPLLEAVHLPYNNLAKLDAAVDDQTAAVVLEVVQGEGGVNLGKAEFLQRAQQLCRERGALLIIDEIQTGFGRTGKWFGYQHFDLEPDLLCLAKGIGAGFPMGAIAYGDPVQAALFPGAHGSTFGGNPLACAAGLAALEVYHAEGLIDRSAHLGEFLLQELAEALHDRTIVREIRGLGLMIAIELREKVGPYLKALMESHRVIALPAGPNVLRLLPPLIINEQEIGLGVRAIADVLPA